VGKRDGSEEDVPESWLRLDGGYDFIDVSDVAMARPAGGPVLRWRLLTPPAPWDLMFRVKLPKDTK
jgi:hypothetical protein